MVLVYLKNLLFPHPHSSHHPSRANTSSRNNNSHLPTTTTLFPTPPSPKYGSFSTSSSSSSPSPNPHDAANPTMHHLHISDLEATAHLLPGNHHGHGTADPGDDDDDGEGSLRSKKKAKFFSPRVIADAIIGLSDGLTVPFALTAGLSTFNDTRVVVYGGLAELIAGSISMGLGGWLAARGELEYYQSTANRTLTLIDTFQAQQRKLLLSKSTTTSIDTSPPPSPPLPHTPVSPPSPIPRMLKDIFTPYHLPPSVLHQLLAHLLSPNYSSTCLLSLLMQFHHNLSPPNPHRATISALTISLGYFLGGFVPLVPYFFVQRGEVMRGLLWSVGVMAVCLVGFGGWKTGMMDVEFDGREGEEGGAGWDEEEVVGVDGAAGGVACAQGKGKSWFGGGRWRKIVKGGLEMLVVGGVAAGGAMGIVRLVGGTGE